MPLSVPIMAVQKRQSVIPPSPGPVSPRTTERRERTVGENGSYNKPNSQAKKLVSSDNKSPQKWNAVSPRASAGSKGQIIDERLKAARERREEREKLRASRELSRLEREQRARRYYEQQVEERKRKLQGQRLKEDSRRAAVEEKRKQRLQEEKERYESVVRKTQEKSQKVQQSPSQTPRGRKPVKHVPRRLPLTSWEKNLVSRLLAPTYSYLARSKSPGCQSGEEVSFHSTTTTTTSTTPITPNTTTPSKPQFPAGSAKRRPPASPSPNNRSINAAQTRTARPPDPVKKNLVRTSNSGSTAVSTSVKAPMPNQSRKPVPSPNRAPRKPVSRQSTPLRLELQSVPEEDVTAFSPALAHGNSRPVRTSAGGQKENRRTVNTPPEAPKFNIPQIKIESVTTTVADRPFPQMPPRPARRPTPQPTSPPTEVVSRPSAGTTDKEEASRLLAEKRREARVQREKEEQEQLQREEAERRSREELERRRAEERARQQAEAERLIEEKRRREKEEQRQAEEERAQAMKEAALLQKQREEEEEAREREKAEKIQRERDMLALREEADRQARKKRLEEIMRRTRRSDSPDAGSVPVRILQSEPQPKEKMKPAHNGTLEHVVKLPASTKSSPRELSNEEDLVPVVAFKERRSLRSLASLEEIQTHQRAEVI